METSVEPIIDAPFTLVLGLGESGVASVKWCARAGCGLRVADSRALPGGIDTLRAEFPEADFRLGNDAVHEAGGETMFALGLLDGVKRVVISPGLPPHEAPARDLIAAARAAGIEVLGEIELFAQALMGLAASGYAPQVLAVTGTNGKTTVCALAGRLLQSAGRSVALAGNISPAALTALMDAQDSGSLPDVWMLELSSFQLETTRSLKPDAAAVLNLSQDHLDWHGNMTAYGAAKARLLAASGVAIINRDDPAVMSMVERVDAENVRSFGRDLPVLAGDAGLDHSHGVAWLTEAAVDEFDAPPPARRKKGEAVVRPNGRVNRLMPVDALQIRGLHNAMNVMAALLLTRSLGLPWAPLLRSVREYRGEPHRVEFLRVIAGVDFIDDSKGTNVGATVAALEGLGQRVVLIAGGVGKGQDFAPLARAAALHARAVVLIGRDAPEIAEVLATAQVSVIQSETLEAAVATALEHAQPGDAVLLSPACASFDMFRNYKHRADVFADAVDALALDRGEV